MLAFSVNIEVVHKYLQHCGAWLGTLLTPYYCVVLNISLSDGLDSLHICIKYDASGSTGFSLGGGQFVQQKDDLKS